MNFQSATKYKKRKPLNCDEFGHAKKLNKGRRERQTLSPTAVSENYFKFSLSLSFIKKNKEPAASLFGSTSFINN